VSNKQPWRWEFFEKSMPTFLATDFPPDTSIVIADDCSTDPRVKEYLRGIKTPANCRIEFIFRKTNQTCDVNMRKTLTYGFSLTRDRYVITADSDALYNRLWIRKLIEARDSVNKPDHVAMITCFDTKSHKIIGDYNDLLVEKKDVGGFCALVNRDIFFNPSMKTECWDWQVCGIAKRLGYKFLCTKQSYVDHLGKGKSGEGKAWDTAKNFVGLDYEDNAEAV
jgi:glycosyltransferase involved in cell wall biosynthesis